MNIFILDLNIEKCAKYHCDKHVIKMPLEAAQMLCTAHFALNTNCDVPYKPTHINNPCSIWARRTKSNYEWLAKLGIELCFEYTHRYNKIRKLEEILKYLFSISYKITNGDLTEFAMAIPNKYKHSNIVESYREYYLNEKRNLFQWSNRKTPYWIK